MHLFHKWKKLSVTQDHTGDRTNGDYRPFTRILYGCTHAECSKVKVREIPGLWTWEELTQEAD